LPVPATLFTVVILNYIFVVVSGGVVLLVSTVFVSTGVDIVESTVVLSEVSEALFVELHADTAKINEPAKARLKIIFFICKLF